MIKEKVYISKGYWGKRGEASIWLHDYYYCVYFLGMLIFQQKIIHARTKDVEAITNIPSSKFIKIESK